MQACRDLIIICVLSTLLIETRQVEMKIRLLVDPKISGWETPILVRAIPFAAMTTLWPRRDFQHAGATAAKASPKAYAPPTHLHTHVHAADFTVETVDLHQDLGLCVTVTSGNLWGEVAKRGFRAWTWPWIDILPSQMMICKIFCVQIRLKS